MTENWELFVDDPRSSSIPNQGVAKVESSEDSAGGSTLRYELKTFVCDGAYREGLLKVLESFLRGVGGEQTAAWISGFYGSGKSHLVKVLEHLWRDEALPDGSTPRGLVNDLGSVDDQLRELDLVGRRNGGRFAAAGSLLNGPKDVNTAVAAILLRAAELPDDVPAARCVLWMHEEGILDSVREYVAARGREWDFELNNLYVSEIADGILAARPGWASSPDTARELLGRQFPSSESLSLPDLLKLIETVLHYRSEKAGKYPATLLVLDEMQAFIDENAGRANEIQGLVEACQSRFDGLVYIVATGQSDLGATPTLQKLIDRFAARQQLSDADVDNVIRQVVLRKRQDRLTELTEKIDANAGEIDRQLGGALIAPAPADAPQLTSDYPILPSRRRFWERALQAIDRGGRAGQLRTQLKVVHEAVRDVASEHVGFVVPADFLFDQQRAGMLTSGTLLREVDELIAAERRNGPDGELRSRVLALVFLISRLSREGFADTGVRSTPDHIADLLVDDLATSGQDLRKRVPLLLQKLRDESKLSLVDGEYILQSKTGQEWTQDFRTRVGAYKADLPRVAMDRDTLVRDELQTRITTIRQHGAAKVARRVSVQFGSLPPSVGDEVPVWVRTGWDTAEAEFRAQATAAPLDSPTVYVLLPKQDDDELQGALAGSAAAGETISQRPNPTTNEGVEARKAIQALGAVADADKRRIAKALADGAIVMQAGGASVAGGDLSDRVDRAITSSLVRLFPRFTDADAANWHLVLNQAVAGKPNALEAIGYAGEPKDHPVCKEVLSSIPAAGGTGQDLRTKLVGPPFGWPLESVVAAAAVLVGSGALVAQLNGSDISASEIKNQSFGKTGFRRETQTLTIDDRLKARGLLADLSIAFTPNEEAPACSQISQSLDRLLRESGGEGPLPAPIQSEHVAALKAKSGAALVKYVAEASEDIKSLCAEARRLAGLRESRLRSYSIARQLVGHLPDNDTGLSDQLSSVMSARSLLTSPDPVAPILGAATEALRTGIFARHSDYSEGLTDALKRLGKHDAWSALDEAQQGTILRDCRLGAEVAPSLGTPDQVRASIERRSLAGWEDLIAAIPARVGHALDKATALSRPDAVRIGLPSATLSTPDDLDEYVAAVRTKLTSALAEHKSIIV